MEAEAPVFTLQHFDDEVLRSAWGLCCMYVTLLFDTTVGLCAWIPVFFGVEVVIVSIPFLRWVVEKYPPPMHSSSGQRVNMKQLLMTQFSNETVDFDIHDRQFQNAILRTPFKPSNDPEDFLVVKANAWKQFLTVVVASNSTANAFKCTRFQQKELEIAAGKTLSVLPGNGKVFCWNKRVPEERKSSMPAFGFSWWRELFSSSVRKFFELGERPKHVVGVGAKVDSGVLNFVKVPGKVNTFAEAKEIV